MRYYFNYSSEESYREGKNDAHYGHSENYDYDKYSDRERDKAYFEGREDEERELRRRREEEREQEEAEQRRQHRLAEERRMEEERYYEECSQEQEVEI